MNVHVLIFLAHITKHLNINAIIYVLETILKYVEDKVFNLTQYLIVIQVR